MADNNSMNTTGSISNSEMDSSTENIDHAVLQSGDPNISAEWSMTASLLNSSNTTSSNPNINIDTLKECCANSSDTLNDKEDFKVLESTSTAINMSKFNADDTKNFTMCKTSAFQKKHKSSFSNMSHMFENLLDDDSQMEVTQNSIYLSRFQKRKRLLPPNDEYYVEMNKSDSSGVDSVDVSMKSSKLRFSSKNKNKSCFEAPDYNLSTIEGDSIADANISKATEEKTDFKHPSNFSLLIYDSTNNVDESKTEVLSSKFTRKPVDLVDSAFDNIINDLSRTSDVELNNKNTTLNESSESTLNSNSICDRAETLGLNNTYDIHANSQSTQVGLLSMSVQNCSELGNTEQPINETYTLEKDLMSNNVSLSSLSAKNTLSDTYTVESNSNDTSAELKSANKTSTLTDMSNLYNQSNSSERKPNFIRKLQMDKVSQDYTISINNGDNSTVNDEINLTDNNKSGRFKLNKMFHNSNSIIFDNIITSSQKNETSSTDAISKTLNTSVETSKPNDSFNISSKSKSKQSEEKSVNKSMTQQSDIQLNEFVENDKSISETSILLQLNKSNSYSSHSGKFNFFKRCGRLSSSYREKSCHDLSVPQSTTFILSQSSGPHFVGKQNITTHSGVFNDIIDNSLNSNVSQNVSKEVKFKNHKNISEADSIIFGNVITNSQESNSTLNINKTLSQSVMYDLSKIQANDEISLYANANELSSNENSLNDSNNSFKNLETNEISNLKESNSLNDDINDTSYCSKNSKTDSYKELCEQNISAMSKESENKSVSNISAGLLQIDSLSCTNLTKSTSNKLSINILGDLNNSFVPEYTPYNLKNTSNYISKHSSIASNSEELTLLYSTSNSLNNSLVLDDNSKNDSKISTRSSKRKNAFSANDRSSASSVANKSLKKEDVNDQSLVQKSPSINQSNSKSFLQNNSRNRSNSSFMFLGDANNESVVSSFTDESNKSTSSSRASKSVAYSNNESSETNDSTFSVSSRRSIDSVKSSQNNSLMLDSDTNDVNTDTSLSNETNNSANHQETDLSLTDELPENKQSFTAKVTRSSSVSVRNNKSLTNKTVLSNESLNSENNLNMISTRSSRISKIVAYSNSECTDNETNESHSSFLTSASSINSGKTSINASMLEDDMNNVSKTSRLSKQKNNSSANNQKTELSLTDELPENKQSFTAKVTRSSSVSVRNNKSLTNKTVLSNESLNSENNLNMISTRSSRISKIVAYSNSECTDNETNVSHSSFLTSASSINSGKTSINASMLEDDMNNVSKTSRSSKQKNNSSANNQKTELSITDELPENKKSISTKVTRSSSVSVKNYKSLTNKTVLDNESLNSENNLNTISTRSSRTKTAAYSSNDFTDIETNDSGSVFWTSASSINSGKTSINVSLLEDDMNNVSKTSRSSKQKNKSFANNQKTELSVTDELPENKKSFSTKVTRSSSVSVKNNKSLTNKTVLDNESLNSENNLNTVSTRSSRTKTAAYSSNDCTDIETNDSGSAFWTSASSINSGKTSINVSMLEDDMNNVSKTSRSSKQKNNSANNQKTELSITDELPENKKSFSTKVTRSSSVSVKNNKSSTNGTVLNNESLNTESNLNKMSIHSSSTKIVARSNNEDIDEINDSLLWSTVSGSSINSRKTSNNTFIPESMDNIDTMPISLSQQINHSFTNDLPTVSSTIDELPEKNKQQSSFVASRSSVSVKNNASLTNKTVLDNESLIFENNVSKMSTSSPKTSKIFTRSNIENIDDDTNDSIFWKTLSETESKNSTHSRRTSKSVDRNDSLVFKNNGNNISSHSSRTLKSVTHSNNTNVGNETNDSVFWTTASESSIGSRTTSNNILISEAMDIVDTTSLSKQINISSENGLSTVSGTRVTRLSSVAFKNNKTIPDNESLISENNVNKTSSSFPKTSKIITDSNSRNIGHETNDSKFWETFSEGSVNSKQIFNNSLVPEDIKNVRRTSTRLSKQNNSFINNSSIISHNNDDLPEINKSLSTRVTRLSSVSDKKKRSSSNNLSMSKNHTKSKSIRSSRSSKNVAHLSNANNDDRIDDSMDWTTVSDDFTNELPNQNDGFQTPKNNKLAITEHIINTIGIMSVNKRNPTHPGVFELEENGPLTRSLTTHLSNHSPSILTRVLVANNSGESISSLLSGTDIIDETQVEDNVKEKFKSLYNKEPWITKRLYNFLISKLQLKYNIFSVKYAEKFVKYLASILKRLHSDQVDFQLYTDMLRYHMARYGIIITTFDYLGFLTDYIPKPYYDRLMPSWDLETSIVKYDTSKYFVPIMEDDEFLRNVLENLKNADAE